MTFTERCKLATGCLPDSPYRVMLEALHREMLVEIPVRELHEEVRNALDSADIKQRMGQWQREP